MDICNDIIILYLQLCDTYELFRYAMTSKTSYNFIKNNMKHFDINVSYIRYHN